VTRPLTVLLAFLALSAPAAAATPEVDARAYVVMNGANGEVLLARNADDRLPVVPRPAHGLQPHRIRAPASRRVRRRTGKGGPR
jgi:uncharacterized protein YqjF (DUF2071 family)